MLAGVVATTIAQAGAIGNQGGSSNLQRFEAYDPLAHKGGGDLMVAGHCFRLVRKDKGASARRKENQFSSSSKKKRKTSASYGFQGWGHYYQGQGQVGASNKMGQMTCYHCHQPGHMRRDCPQRRGSRNYGTTHSQSLVGQVRTQFFPSITSLKVLQRRLRLHR